MNNDSNDPKVVSITDVSQAANGNTAPQNTIEPAPASPGKKTAKFKIIISIICCALVLVIAIVAIILLTKSDQYVSDKFRVEKYNGKDYYILQDTYNGEYDLHESAFNYIKDESDTRDWWDIESEQAKEFSVARIMSLQEYSDYCKHWGIAQKYNNPNQNYLVISEAVSASVMSAVKLVDVIVNSSTVDVYLYSSFGGVVATADSYAIFIPIDPSINSFNITSVILEKEFKNIKKYGSTQKPGDFVAEKPIIYLYPTKETEVSVELGNPDNLIVSYPTYKDGWHLRAYPDGTLVDLSTDRDLYALYYESNPAIDLSINDEGFVIRGEDTAEFLEEKLSTLGLNSREAEEFIIYWLPRLKPNAYNYIRFASASEIEANMPLNINPTPDSTIRILMLYSPLEHPINVTEQQLNTPDRNGFTAVEWGGMEIK